MRRLAVGLLLAVGQASWPVVLATAAQASDDLLTRLQDAQATVAQRNDACCALRGNRSAPVVAALGRVLADPVVRACAARDLREAGAAEALIAALDSQDADVQMAAALELGAMREPRALPALGRTALDVNALVASSAIHALAAYVDGAGLPYLLRAAQQPGVAGVTALESAAASHDRAVLPIARRTLAQGDVAAQLIALSVIADLGDESDLPKLKEMAAKRELMESRGRGFGFMPVIDLGRAAQNAIDKIGGVSGAGPRPSQ